MLCRYKVIQRSSAEYGGYRDINGDLIVTPYGEEISNYAGMNILVVLFQAINQSIELIIIPSILMPVVECNEHGLVSNILKTPVVCKNNTDVEGSIENSQSFCLGAVLLVTCIYGHLCCMCCMHL